MRKITRIVLLALIVQVIFGSFVASASTNSSLASSDISGHWAEATIKSWLDKGYINGYSDGSFRPNNKITRAEFVKIVNGVFQVEKSEATLNYSDLPQSHWAYGEIAAAVQADYVSGTTETTVSPDKVIARQEAAVMLVKLTGLKGSAELNFKDAADIPQWSKKAIETLVAGGFMKGDTAGNFRAKDGLTRAEAVVLLDNISAGLETKFETAGQYGSTEQVTVINGDVRITAAGVTLVNTEINGNLIIDKAVGEGDVYLKQVKVSGSTVVNGGGENSVHLEDTIIVNLIVDKATGMVRIVASGATSVQQVAVQSPVKLEESQTSETGFQHIELTPSLPPGSDVELIGHFESVAIMAASIQVKIPSGSIGQLNVDEKATNNKIDLVEGVTVEKLILDIVAQIIGQGTINQAQVTPAAEKSTFETKPKQLEVVDSSGNPIPSPTPTPELIPDFPSIPTSPTTPTPTKTPQKSNDATIHSLTINEGLVLNKQYWKQQQGKSIEGFATDHMQYYVDLPGDDQEMEFKLNVQAEKNAEVSFYVTDYDNDNNDKFVEAVNNQLTLDINSSHSYSIFISVLSESETHSKSYTVDLYGEWNAQQAFNLIGFKHSNKVEYLLASHFVKIGDNIIVTIPAEYSSTETERVVQETIQSSSEYVNGTYTYHSLNLGSSFNPSSNRGELGLKIIRNGVTLYDGDYEFDVSPIEYVNVDQPLNSSLFNIKFVEKEELDKWNTEFVMYSVYAYEFSIEVDEEELSKLYPNAKYWVVSTVHKDGMPKNEYYMYDSVKPTKTYYRLTYPGLNNIHSSVYFYDLMDKTEETYEVPTGQTVRVHFFDEDLQLLEGLKLDFDVPTEKLATGAVPMEIISQEELENVPIQISTIAATVENSSIQWNQTTPFLEEFIGEGFDPEHKNHRSILTDVMTDKDLNLDIEVAKGLLVQISVESYNYETLKTSHRYYSNKLTRNNINFKLEDKVDYTIRVVVQNPYTEERFQYNFLLKAHRDYEELISLIDNSIRVQNLQQDDVLEVILPADNDSGETSSLFFVSQGDATEYFRINDYYHSELDRLVYFVGNGVLGIKLTRQNSVIYEGELAFDYTPMNLLDGAKIRILNDEERLALFPSNITSPDFAYEIDISAVEGAAYASRYRLSLATSPLGDDELDVPSKQTSNPPEWPATTFISNTTVSSMEISKYLYISYIIYNQDRQAIGYVLLSAELSDEYVNDLKTIISSD